MIGDSLELHFDSSISLTTKYYLVPEEVGINVSNSTGFEQWKHLELESKKSSCKVVSWY